MSMVLGLIAILSTIARKTMNGDLVIYSIKHEFEKYLEEAKFNSCDRTVVRIYDEIEFYPRMIESLYQFLLENREYGELVFGNRVKFKGSVEQYYEMIGVVK